MYPTRELPTHPHTHTHTVTHTMESQSTHDSVADMTAIQTYIPVSRECNEQGRSLVAYGETKRLPTLEMQFTRTRLNVSDSHHSFIHPSFRPSILYSGWSIYHIKKCIVNVTSSSLSCSLTSLSITASH